MAGFRGATDAVTFGVGDRIVAADVATRTKGAGGTWNERYDTIRRHQMAEDEYDAKHRAVARNVGGFIGSLAPMALTGGLGAAPIAVARAAANVPRTAKGAAKVVGVLAPRVAVAAGGAGIGAASQIESDIVANRPINGAAVASSAAGGASGALFGSRSAPLGAAVSAVVSNLSHAGLTGEPVSVDKVLLDAGTGVIFAAAGRSMGHGWSNNLPSNKYVKKGRPLSKEELGEGLGEFLTRLRGERHIDRQMRLPVTGSFTKVDEVTGSWFDPLVRHNRERKFGFGARLSGPQRKAQAEQGDQYLVDHFTPTDIGNAFGSAAGIAGAQGLSREDK